MNHLALLGRLTRDPELRHTNSGVVITKGAIAVDSFAGKDSNGNPKKRTLFLDFTAFEKTAENIAKFFKKGSPICLEGELELHTWDKDGQTHRKHDMRVQRFSFVPGAPKTDTPATADSAEPPLDNAPF